MEHEVFVPVVAERLREALADPARVARAVPGLQQDAGAEPVSGRLKVRVGSHSVTYRGTARVSGLDDGSYAVEGDATETRGSGSVKLTLTLRLRDAEGGAILAFEAVAAADGRVTDLPADAVGSAVVRLLNRFAENLGAATAEEGRPEQPKPPRTERAEAGQEPETGADEDQAPEPEPGPRKAPRPLDAHVSEDAGPGPGDGFEEPAAAEAAHARRTMIGRSAEEVDHAPPRGRYAPVPAPQTITPASALRWAAPAAAVVLASAIVAGRVLRRRH
ncbi:SRPBCC domain-containing protein [Streptomyces sp. NPDC005574]|uniref:SRPBCC domain-containing protein n=1 Tax=Streptomyces sp. NPDC005574 TaxID=3156891 RepID=UPI0033A84B62